MSRRLPWFRMYTDFLTDPKLIALAFEDQRHFIGVLALKCDGAIDDTADGDLLDRIVAQRLWIDHAVIREVKRRLVAAGLIDGRWQPLAWDRRQMKSDQDATAAERQRRYRESRQRNALHNGSVTRLEVDVDTDTDTEEEKSIGAADAALNAIQASNEPQRKTSGTPKRATQLPEDFEPDDTAAALAAELGVSLAAELPKFRDYHAARGKPMKDWQAAMRTWLRNAKQFAKPAAKQTESERRAAWLADITGRTGDAIDAPARLVG